ncbi:MAG TPA: hypothetical protein VFE46_10820 [Pirellulales bacterium]|jgi:hypothetical protein|nr:hypothetical protein [Pirellulales bacterium]
MFRFGLVGLILACCFTARAETSRATVDEREARPITNCDSSCPRKDYQDVVTPVVTPGSPVAPPVESGPDKATGIVCLVVAAALGLHREANKHSRKSS